MERRRKRGLSQIASVVIIVLLAIVSSIIIYVAWVKRYSSTEEAGLYSVAKLKIVAVEGYRGYVVVHVQNLGDRKVVVDSLYVERAGNIVAIGRPLTSAVLGPKSISGILFRVGTLPDGTYVLHVTTREGIMCSSGEVYLRLATGFPVLVFNEAKLRGNDANAIELYNPTDVPINVSMFTIIIQNPYWRENVRIRLTSTSSIVMYVNDIRKVVGFIYIRPKSIIIPPKSYLVFRGDYRKLIFDIANFTVRIVDYKGLVVDDAGAWLGAIQEGIDPQRLSLQRISVVPPRWVFAEPTLGGPNALGGIEATT